MKACSLTNSDSQWLSIIRTYCLTSSVQLQEFISIKHQNSSFHHTFHMLQHELSVCPCPSVRPSVTSRCSTKTAKRRITQTTPHDSPRTLVFWCQRSPRNSTGSPPTRAPNAGGAGQNRRLLTNSRLYLENDTR